MASTTHEPPHSDDTAPITPHTPMTLRILGAVQRGLYSASGGRIGSMEPGQAPRGRVLKVITDLHLLAYRWTGGLIGDSTSGLPTLLLTTIGNKSGLERTVPLPWFPFRGGYLVVGSNAGQADDPAWAKNIAANPDVTVQIGRQIFKANARRTTGDQRREAWSRVVAHAPFYAGYEQRTTREIPVVLLTPK